MNTPKLKHCFMCYKSYECGSNPNEQPLERALDTLCKEFNIYENSKEIPSKSKTRRISSFCPTCSSTLKYVNNLQSALDQIQVEIKSQMKILGKRLVDSIGGCDESNCKVDGVSTTRKRKHLERKDSNDDEDVKERKRIKLMNHFRRKVLKSIEKDTNLSEGVIEPKKPSNKKGQIESSVVSLTKAKKYEEAIKSNKTIGHKTLNDTRHIPQKYNLVQKPIEDYVPTEYHDNETDFLETIRQESAHLTNLFFRNLDHEIFIYMKQHHIDIFPEDEDKCYECSLCGEWTKLQVHSSRQMTEARILAHISFHHYENFWNDWE